MKTKIKNTLQLHNKWVKIMLTVSVIVIVLLSFYPENGFQQKAAETISVEEINPEMQILSREDSVLFMIENYERNTQKLSAPIRTPASNDSVMQVIEDPKSSSQEPIIIQIVKEKEDFNWKEMISWIIGGMNGMVLLVMNLKNLKKK